MKVQHDLGPEPENADDNATFAIAMDDSDQLWVVNADEGTKLFHVPEQMAEFHDEDPVEAELLMIELAVSWTLMRDEMYDLGVKVGKESAARDLQHLLGIDKIVSALEAK